MTKIPNRPKETSLMSNYSRSDLAFVRGKGVRLFDKTGKMFLDFGSGIAVNSLGHSHPKLIKVLADQGSKLWHTSNLYTVPKQEELANELTDNTFADKVFFTNSGAESVECSIKIARRFYFSKGQPNKNRIISFEGSFHGRTMGAISAAGSRKLLEGFGPKLPGFDTVRKLSLESVERKISERTCAILVEPILGEGGIITLSCSFLKGLKQLCKKYNLLLIFDEVQCGMGRSGKLFAYETANVTPDIMGLAKGIGGGFPVGAVLATEKAASGMVPGTHGSTYGGNPLAMAAANAVLDVMLEKDFLSSVVKKGTKLKNDLVSLVEKHSTVLESVRGVGLMLGIKSVGPNLELMAAFRENKLLTVVAGENVVRVLPPLNVSEEEISEAVQKIDQTCSQVSS